MELPAPAARDQGARRRRGASAEIEEHIFSEKYLLERPLLAAIRRDKPPVLLIDEVDRADEEFEAFLLELLSDFQVTIPELGTIAATTIPRVVLTSNGTRELSDALRRRCLYHYLDFPDVDREARIILARLPADRRGAGAADRAHGRPLRKEDLRKVPGVAETLDWAATLAGLDVRDLREEPETVHETLACVLKTARRQVARHARGDGSPAGEGGVKWTRRQERIPAGRRANKLGGLRCKSCATTAFAIGLGETRDALRFWQARAATGGRPFVPPCAPCSADVNPTGAKFDEIFDAFWSGRGMKTAFVASGAGAARAFRPAWRNVGRPARRRSSRPKPREGEAAARGPGQEPRAPRRAKAWRSRTSAI